MKTVYQVQFRTLEGQNAGVWQAFSSQRKYDITESLEEAKRILANAKAWHNHCKDFDNRPYEYRIATVQYTVEYTEA